MGICENRSCCSVFSAAQVSDGQTQVTAERFRCQFDQRRVRRRRREKNLYVMCARRKRADPYRIASHSDMGACVHIQRKAESGITFSALFHTVSRERWRLIRNIIFQVDGWIVDPGSGGDSFATAAASAAAAAERLGVAGGGGRERERENAGV